MIAHVRRVVWLSFALVVVAIASAAPPIPPDRTPNIWLASHKALFSLDPASNTPSGPLALSDEAEGLAVDPRDGTVWALSHKRLSKFDHAGQLLLNVSLKDLEPIFDEADAIMLNPYEGAVWIAGKKQLLCLTDTGAKHAAWSAPNKIEAIALDLDETLWVLTKAELAHIAEDGRILSMLDLKPHAKDAKNLIVDGLGGLLWIVEEKALLRFDTNRLDQPPLRIALPKDQDQVDTETAASHPIFGTLWLAGKDALLLYDRSGVLIKQVDLTPHGLGEIEAMAYEPVSASLWLAGKKSVVRFTGNGDYVTRIDMQKEIEAIAAGPFILAPSLTLISPPDNALTNNPAPRLEYDLGAQCSGAPCLLVDSYIDSLNLAIDLNGQPIGPLFSRNGARAFYDPTTRLPEGTNTLKAKATDVFGHVSPEIMSRFTIDTIPPAFVSIAPPDGSTLTQAAITISGAVDDPTANVILADANGQGISMGGANFNFSVILTNGLNSFLLTARDPAGNATTFPLRLTLSAVSIKIESPTQGANLSSGQVIVSGSFKGPFNTGVTLNGQPALVSGNQFWANVSLAPGPNTLTAIATAPSGLTAQHAITVNLNRATPDPLAVTAEPQSGVGPMTARFTVGYSGPAITRIQADYNGDGATDFTTTDPNALIEHIYTQPGVYHAKLIVTDAQNGTHSQTIAIVVHDAAQMDQLFAALWDGMNGALVAGDVNRATGYLNESAKRKYGPVFQTLLPHMSQIISSYSPLKRLSIAESIGEYAIVRPYSGQNRVYLIYFLKDTDGVWRVDGM